MFNRKRKKEEINNYQEAFKQEIAQELEKDPFTKQRFEEGVWTGIDIKKPERRKMKDFNINEPGF